MEEGEDPGGGGGTGECCRKMARVLREEFHGKFKEMEQRMTTKETELRQYV